MKIKHFCNSFISVTCGSTTLVCDPWVGKADNSAWISYPFKEGGEKLVEAENPNFIYISHVHDDHIDPKLLRLLNKDIAFVIKYFENQHLYNRIKALGFSKIVEVDSWQPYSLSDDMDVAIVTASNMLKDGKELSLDYDLDTSIHIRDRKTNCVFFNNVDTPNNVDDLRRNSDFSKLHWARSIDVACVPVGAASYYPQNFINLDRDACKEELVQRSLAELPDRLAALGAPTIFIAGGTYVIPGKFAPLNKWIAQPTFAQIEEHLQGWLTDANAIHYIEGGGTLSFNPETSTWNWEHDTIGQLPDMRSYSLETRSVPYHYGETTKKQLKSDAETLAEMENLFFRAKKNYQSKLSRLKIEQTWRHTFKLYRDLRLTNDGFMVPDTPLLVLELEPKDDAQNLSMVFHMDADFFYETLANPGSLSTSLAGSHSLVERTPNVFLPDAEFTLVFLKP